MLPVKEFLLPVEGGGQKEGSKCFVVNGTNIYRNYILYAIGLHSCLSI